MKSTTSYMLYNLEAIIDKLNNPETIEAIRRFRKENSTRRCGYCGGAMIVKRRGTHQRFCGEVCRG